MVYESTLCSRKAGVGFSDLKTAQTISRIVFNRKGVFTREHEPKMSVHTLRELWNSGEEGL